MRLGVDVDGVILDVIPLHRAALEKRGYVSDSRIQNTWSYTESHGAPPEVTKEVFKEVEQLTDVPLIPGAQILNKIVELPHIESPIYFVSSRSLEARQATIKALERHFSFPFSVICEVGKGWVCNHLQLDFFVEDGPPHIRDIFWNSTTKIYILDKPYNQEIDFPGSMKCLRVKNWDEILVDLAREGYREAVKYTPQHPDFKYSYGRWR